MDREVGKVYCSLMLHAPNTTHLSVVIHLARNKPDTPTADGSPKTLQHG